MGETITVFIRVEKTGTPCPQLLQHLPLIGSAISGVPFALRGLGERGEWGIVEFDAAGLNELAEGKIARQEWGKSLRGQPLLILRTYLTEGLVAHNCRLVELRPAGTDELMCLQELRSQALARNTNHDDD